MSEHPQKALGTNTDKAPVGSHYNQTSPGIMSTAAPWAQNYAVNLKSDFACDK